MRTTVTIADHLLIEAKQLAARRRTSFTAVLEDSLRVYLAQEREREPPRIGPALPVIEDARPVAGIDLDDTSSLLAIE